MMTVKELIDELQRLDPDRVVILQKDSEGNGYSPLRGCDGENVVYQADSTWSGEVSYERLTDELRAQGYDDEDVSDGVPCVVLFPVN